jgi:phytoene/squalene synthetase
VPEPEPPKQRVDIQRVSSICTDLARVVDTRTLPSLLERAAEALDAAGIVLWVADPDGRELAAIMAHGYAPNLVVRLGTINRDAENATAAAFRTSLVQTVSADDVSNGAIAAPLVGGAGCVGVMAAEVRNRGERDDTVLAAAGIIAAQLATLVAPPSSRAKAEATG